MALLSEYTRVPLINIPVNTRLRDHTTLPRPDGSQENAPPAAYTQRAHLTRLLARYARLTSTSPI